MDIGIYANVRSCQVIFNGIAIRTIHAMLKASDSSQLLLVLMLYAVPWKHNWNPPRAETEAWSCMIQSIIYKKKHIRRTQRIIRSSSKRRSALDHWKLQWDPINKFVGLGQRFPCDHSAADVSNGDFDGMASWNFWDGNWKKYRELARLISCLFYARNEHVCIYITWWIAVGKIKIFCSYIICCQRNRRIISPRHPKNKLYCASCLQGLAASDFGGQVISSPVFSEVFYRAQLLAILTRDGISSDQVTNLIIVHI